MRLFPDANAVRFSTPKGLRQKQAGLSSLRVERGKEKMELSPFLLSQLDKQYPWKILILSFYHDKLGEDLVFLTPIVRRFMATFPDAKIKIAMDKPIIFKIDSTLNEYIEFVVPKAEDDAISRSQMSPSGRDGLYARVNASLTVENNPCDILVDLTDDETWKVDIASIIRKESGRQLPYVLRWKNLCRGDELETIFYDRQGKEYGLPKIPRKNVYEATETACDILGLKQVKGYPVHISQTDLAEGRAAIKDKLSQKGVEFDPLLPIVILNMFANNQFEVSFKFIEQWKKITERLALVKHSYIVVSSGDKQAGKWRYSGNPSAAMQVKAFDEIADKLEKSSDYVILLDRPSPDDIRDQEDSLRTFIEIMALANIVITPDTGTLHLAYFLRKAIVLITNLNENAWLPPQEEMRNYRKMFLVNTDDRGAFVDCLDILQDLSVFLQVEKVRKNEKKLQTVFDNAADGILMVNMEDRMFDSANKSMCLMLGYSLDELQKLKMTDIHPKEQLPYILEQIERQLEAPFIHAEDIQMKRKDGSLFYANVHGSRIVLSEKEYLLGIFRDITERKKMEEALQNDQIRLTAVLDSIDALVYVADFNSYELLFLNKYGRKEWGDIAGKRCWETIQEGQEGPCKFCTNNRLLSGTGVPMGVYR